MNIISDKSTRLLCIPVLCVSYMIYILDVFSLSTRHSIAQDYPYISGDVVYIQSGLSYTIERAITPKKRETGLMNRTGLDSKSGMLFVFDTMGIYPFWMKNTLIPLDILWLDENLQIIDSASMVPCVTETCPVYTPTAPARYALEIAAGQLAHIYPK